jgi:hypothetical protein
LNKEANSEGWLGISLVSEMLEALLLYKLNPSIDKTSPNPISWLNGHYTGITPVGLICIGGELLEEKFNREWIGRTCFRNRPYAFSVPGWFQ